MVGRPRSFFGCGIMSAMRWLGLLLLASCTLITDPSSFEGEVSDAGADGGTDSSVDAATDAGPDAPLDASSDAPVAPCCEGETCIVTPLASFSSPQQLLRQAARTEPTIGGTRQVRLVTTPEGIATIRPAPGLMPEYQVISGASTQDFRQWLRSQSSRAECVTEGPIADVDVKRHGGELTATILRPSLGTNFELFHVGSDCAMYALSGQLEGFAAAGANAYARAKPMLARPEDPPSVLFRDDSQFEYTEVIGLDALGRLAIVITRTAGTGVHLEYWLGGVGQGAEPIGVVSAPPRITSSRAPDDFFAGYGLGGSLELEQVSIAGGDLSHDIVNLDEPLAVGSVLAIGSQPAPSLVFVVAPPAPDAASVTLWVIDPSTGQRAEIESHTAPSAVRGVDLLVDGAPGEPLTITYAIASQETEVRQLRLCPPM